MHLDASAVSRLDPPLITDKTHGAGSQRLDPSRTLAEGRVQAIEHQLHSIGIKGVDLFPRSLVFHRTGVVGFVGPLTEIDRVCSPVEQPRAGVKIPVSAPPS